MDLRHGQHDIRVEDNIIFITMFDDFNEYDIKAITAELQTLIEQFQQTPFFLLIDILNCEGGTPEAFEESRKFNHWLDQQNLKAKAILCRSNVLKEINEARVRQTNKQLIQYFDTKAQAMKW